MQLQFDIHESGTGPMAHEHNDYQNFNNWRRIVRGYGQVVVKFNKVAITYSPYTQGNWSSSGTTLKLLVFVNLWRANRRKTNDRISRRLV